MKISPKFHISSELLVQPYRIYEVRKNDVGE